MIRIVLGEPGPAGSTGPTGTSSGAVARALRDAGHEVVYAGPGQSLEQLVASALQEDADLIGLVTAEGEALVGVLGDLLRDHDAADIGVVATSGSTVAEIVAQVALRAASDSA